MISQIIKRDGSIEPFNAEKIILVITKAGKATGQFDRAVAEELYQQEIFPILAEKRTTLNIEEIQDLVEKALFNTGFQETHKAFVLYRQSRKQEREKKKVAVDVQSSIDEYVTQSDWRVRANANQGYSLGGMILNVAGKVTANYWLSYVYPPEVGNAHRNGDFHIHDLDMLTGYCCGHSLRALLNEGFNGVPNKVESNPPKHLSSAMLQMVNFLGSLQNEWSGAQAFSSFDTYLAPFVRVDKLTYSEVKQEMQEFVFSMNAPSRWGCVPITTEVLTVDGWKGHYSLKETDKVYSFNEKGELCLSNVNRIIHKKNSNGKLYSFKNKHYGYEQLVTTNHRVICAKTVNLDSLDVSDWHIRLAEDIAASDKRGKLPVAFTGIAGDFSSFKNTDTEIKLAAAFYCDGSFDFRNDSIHKVAYYKSPLRQKPEWFENLCKEYGLQYSVVDKSTEMSEHVLHYTFYGDSARKIVNLVGDKNKIASRFLNMPKAQSELFLYTWACHDGEEEKMCLQFDTTTVAKQLQHIAVNAGFTSYIKQKNASRYVKIRRVTSVGVKEIEEVVYSGDVWCPSVTFGTVIFRDRFGNVFISGNTQTPFTNLTFDIHCPDDLRDQHPLIGGEEVDFTYGDLQKEMDMLNKAYIEVMTEGDAKGRVFTFPIPTYNITKDFDWDSPNSDLLFEMTAKYGLPYFQNFTNSDLDPHMIRSMCPMLGDTLVVYKLNKEDAESKVSKVRELVGKEIWVKYKDEWKLSCGNKSFKQDCYEIVDEKATHYLGENHLQPVIRDGKEITVSVKDLLLTDKLIYTDGDKKILKMTNIGSSDDLYCIETLGETDNHLFELQDGLITHNCRLRLDLTELLRRGNGLFGSAEQTGCYDEETEVLTKDGWKFWKDVTMDDEFYTLSKERKIEIQKPVQLFKKYYDGKMYHFKTRNLDLKVTPNHNVLLENPKNELVLKRADEFAKNFWHYGIPKRGKWEGKKREFAELNGVEGTKFCFNHPYTFKSVNRVFNMKDWVAFLGIFLSEGYFHKGVQHKGKDYLIIVSQKKPHVRALIKELFGRMGIKYSETSYKNAFSIHCKTLHNYLKQFGLQKDRFIPRDILELDKEYLEVLYRWLMLGDGSVSKTGQETYYTNSKRLADDVQELIIKLGFGSSVVSRVRLHNNKLNTIYEVSKHVTTDKFWIQTREKIKEVDYHGMIYCAEVPNHTLMVRRNGKATWCGNSVGVVTINCARLGYLFKDDKEGLYKRLDYLLELAKNSLELRRKTISRLLKDGLYPYTKRYLGSYRNFFSTIGVNGINEMIRNFTDDTDDITTERGHKMAVELLEHIREREVEFQKETGNMYNLEASPAEGCTYRFAKEDRKRFPDIIQAGTESNPYYTNSSQLPVNYTDDPFEALAKQEELQCLYTGGTSCHLYMNERISTAEMCKRIVRKALTQFRLPYITITPTFSICPKHGYIAGEHKFCPKCDAELIAKKRHEKCCC